MSCTGCGSNYGVFKREVGCTMCGFSFCSKCCNTRLYKTDEADPGTSTMICNKCYNETNSTKKPQTYSPPLAHKKRMAAWGSRSQSLAAGGASSSHWDDERDKEIAERLQKLKREIKKGSPPSQVELETRLAKLKGMDPGRYTAPPITVYRAPDRRSSTEQVADLFTQMQEEVQIDMRREKEWNDDVTARLSSLRDNAVPECRGPSALAALHEAQSSEDPMDVESESKTFGEQSEVLMREAAEEMKSLKADEAFRSIMQGAKSKDVKKIVAGEFQEDDYDEEANNVLAKLIDINLDDPDSLNGIQMKSPDSECDKTETLEENEEFPWCVICTEDAKIRCFGCDSDLYCLNCFSECHDSLDIKDHKTCPYLKPKV